MNQRLFSEENRIDAYYADLSGAASNSNDGFFAALARSNANIIQEPERQSTPIEDDVDCCIELDIDVDEDSSESSLFGDSDESENEMSIEEDGGLSESLWVTAGTLACKMSVDDYNSLLVALHSVYKLPDCAMDGFCILFASCLPEGHKAPVNFASLVKSQLGEMNGICRDIVYVCSEENCKGNLLKEYDTCRQRSCTLRGQWQNATGFVNCRIRLQIEKLLQSRLTDILQFLSASANSENGAVGDIISTPAYSSFGPNPSCDGTLSISLILSSDGAQVFKSSRNSFWPCVAIISELPPKVRVLIENAIVLGFWVGHGGQKKPDWVRFLASVVTELEVLKEGFFVDVHGRRIRVSVRLLATIFDLPAQASIWNHKQWNGDYGCLRCMHQGERPGKRKLLNLYPVLDDVPEKTADFFENAWQQLSESSSTNFYGVTGVSLLHRLGNPATVNVFDPMHMIYRGNALLIFARLFTSQTSKWEALFWPKTIKKLDKLIKNVRFPITFNRRIPRLKALGTFKASEVKNLLLYVITAITAPYMDPVSNWWHWLSVYVHAIRLLSQPVVEDSHIERAKRLIKVWQRLIPTYCHKLCQNFNSHSVGHLPDQVQRFGPIWTISTFAFEGYNGHFSRYVKASKGAVQQLARRFALQSSAFRYLSVQVREQRECSKLIKKMFPVLYKKWETKSDEQRCRLVDLNLSFYDQEHEIIEIIRRHFSYYDGQDISFANRLVLGSETLHSLCHSAKTASTIKYNVRTENEEQAQYGIIKIFFSFRDNICAVVKEYKTESETNVCLVAPPTDEQLLSLFENREYGSFFWLVSETDRLSIVEMRDFICSAIVVPAHGNLTVTDLVSFEHD